MKTSLLVYYTKLLTHLIVICTIILQVNLIQADEISAKTDQLQNQKQVSYFSFEEIQKINELRKRLGSDLYNELLQSDDLLVRYLRATDQDVMRASELLKETIKWRRENGVDNFSNWDTSKFSRKYKYFLDPGARHGGPVVTVPNWNIRQMMLAGQRKEVSLYLDKIFEEAETFIRAANASSPRKRITQAILIIDLHNFNLRENVCFACLPFYVDLFIIYEKYHPQILSDIFIINTPRILREFFRTVITPLMSKYTASIMRIHGVDKIEYQRALEKVIHVETVSARFGGIKEN